MQNNPLNSDQTLQNNPFNTCNEGISNGFGPMFFNIRDPSFNKTNIPVPQETSKHPLVICGTLFFYGGLIVAMLLISTETIYIALAVLTYLRYLYVSICCSDIRQYFNNIKKFD